MPRMLWHLAFAAALLMIVWAATVGIDMWQRGDLRPREGVRPSQDQPDAFGQIPSPES
jgi:hypothetical protein